MNFENSIVVVFHRFSCIFIMVCVFQWVWVISEHGCPTTWTWNVSTLRPAAPIETFARFQAVFSASEDFHLISQMFVDLFSFLMIFMIFRRNHSLTSFIRGFLFSYLMPVTIGRPPRCPQCPSQRLPELSSQFPVSSSQLPAQLPQFRTRNQKPETKQPEAINQKPDTRHQKPETETPETRNQQPETRHKKPKTRK